MAIDTINNNTSAQLQAYTQQKVVTGQKTQQQATAKTVVSVADSVQISEQAKTLLAQDLSNTLQGNGGGIIPPGNTTQGNGGGIIPPGNTTLGNGGGIIPPGNTTLGNGGGIIPPGNAPVTGAEDSGSYSTLGNGGGIIPPGN